MFDKEPLRQALCAVIKTELESAIEAQKVTMLAAVHPEARAEHAKDTRATETAYLARGLAKRVTEMETALSQLETLALRPFDQDTPITLTALVTLEPGNEPGNGNNEHYFLSPAGAGHTLDIDGLAIRVVTAASPLGAGLLGQRVGDSVELKSRQGARTLHIVAVC